MLIPEPAQVALLLALFLLFALINLVQAALKNMNRTSQRELAEAGHAGSRRALALDEARERLDVALQACSLLLVVAFAWLARSALLPMQADSLSQVSLIVAAGFLLQIAGRMIPQVTGAAWADRLAPALAGAGLLLLRLAWPVIALAFAAQSLPQAGHRCGEAGGQRHRAGNHDFGGRRPKGRHH